MMEKSEVKHVAKLARLKLSDEEIDQFTQQLGKIIEYVHILESINTEGVHPTAHILPLKNVFRDDLVVDSINREAILANAPESEGGYFKTPKILGS